MCVFQFKWENNKEKVNPYYKNSRVSPPVRPSHPSVIRINRSENVNKNEINSMLGVYTNQY